MALIVLLAIATVNRNASWRDPVRLWADVAGKAPANGRAHYNLALEYKKIGSHEKAIIEFHKAIRLGGTLSELSEAFNNLGRIYEQTGDLDQAASAYKEAIALDPHSHIAMNNLGLIYLQKHAVMDAIQQFKKSIAYAPGYAKAHYNLGRAFASKGLPREANIEFRKAAELGMDTPLERTD